MKKNLHELMKIHEDFGVPRKGFKSDLKWVHFRGFKSDPKLEYFRGSC